MQRRVLSSNPGEGYEKKRTAPYDEMVVEGRYAKAKVYTVRRADNPIDEHAVAQVKLICNTEACKGSKIRVMPDVHAGKMGPVGLTMTLPDKVMPALIGNDIGCGVSQRRFNRKLPIDFLKLDKEIRNRIPFGAAIQRAPLTQAIDRGSELVNHLHCAEHIQKDRALMGLCTLGGGNHFIELGCDAHDGIFALTVHSGSRNLGNQVYEWYMKVGQKALKDLGLDVPYEMTWIDGDLKKQYLEDIQTVCAYAKLNRELIINEIVKAMKWKKYLIGNDDSLIDCPHNFVGWDGILRKGAIMADELENVLIPVNMHDGIIVGLGKGNTEWNYSAPHGSGRILKRSEVSNNHTVSEFKRAMDGIWSSCINASTLDESPFAYRQLVDILPSIDQTVCVDPDNPVMRPLYNFKVCEGA